jgi:rsbT co-antagonist protein RsbR
MVPRVRAWFAALPYTNPTDVQQARLLQAGLLVWLGFGLIAAASNFSLVPQENLPPPPPLIIAGVTLLTIAGFLLWIVPLAALILLRRGYFHHAVNTACPGFLSLQVLALAASGSTSATALVLFQIPIALAGLLGSRRLLWAVAFLSSATVLGVAVGERTTPPLAGFFGRLNLTTGELLDPLPLITVVITVGFFCGAAVVLALLLDRFGGALRVALGHALAREGELQQIRGTLETMVAERTQALQAALAEVQTRADTQAQLLDEIVQQQVVINELSMPVIPVSDQVLVLPLVGALDSQRLNQLQAHSLQALVTTTTRVLILDITGVPVIDQAVGQGLLQTMRAARLMGVEVMLVGIRPEVAQTLVGLNLTLAEMRTFANLQAAIAHLGHTMLAA